MKNAFEEYGSVIVLAIVGLCLIAGFKEVLDYVLSVYG